MGWSCTMIANRKMEAITAACKATHDGPSNNVYRIGTKLYFFEVNRITHEDGSVTGSLHVFVGETHARKVGTFKIDGNGRVVRGPKFTSTRPMRSHFPG